MSSALSRQIESADLVSSPYHGVEHQLYHHLDLAYTCWSHTCVNTPNCSCMSLYCPVLVHARCTSIKNGHGSVKPASLLSHFVNSHYVYQDHTNTQGGGNEQWKMSRTKGIFPFISYTEDLFVSWWKRFSSLLPSKGGCGERGYHQTLAGFFLPQFGGQPWVRSISLCNWAGPIVSMPVQNFLFPCVSATTEKFSSTPWWADPGRRHKMQQ